MTKRLSLTLALLLGGTPAFALPLPFFQDPMGPITDVTGHAADYQPAEDFCVRPDVGFAPTDALLGAAFTPAGGTDSVCAASGFSASDTGLYKGHVATPPLCAGCRRIFFDYSKIPANRPEKLLYYAHGHVYFHLGGLNPAYTIDPTAHSPNVKNFTNDKLVVPDGSPQQPLVAAFDLHAAAYTGNTAHFIHNHVQGPYYVGPWYVSAAGKRVAGAYLDVSVAGRALPVAVLNEIDYQAGFDAGDPLCPSNDFGPTYVDADVLYGGCVAHFGFSSKGVNPYP